MIRTLALFLLAALASGPLLAQSPTPVASSDVRVALDTSAGRIVVALHPGTVETSLTRDYADRYPTITAQHSAEALLSVIEGLTPEDNGGFFDWKGKQVPW